MPKLRLLKGECCVSASATHRRGNNYLQHVVSMLYIMFNSLFVTGDVSLEVNKCCLTIGFFGECCAGGNNKRKKSEKKHENLHIKRTGFICIVSFNRVLLRDLCFPVLRKCTMKRSLTIK